MAMRETKKAAAIKARNAAEAQRRTATAGAGQASAGGPTSEGSTAEARRAIWHGYRGQPPALEMEQQILPSMPSTVAVGSVIIVQLRNVGLIRSLNVRVTFSVTGGGTTSQTRTALGPANFFSTIDFQDYSTYHRITTQGWHVTLLEAAKQRSAPWAALTSDTPVGIANNNPGTLAATSIAGMQAQTTITAAATGVCQAVYKIPFARTRFDLRGALWAKVSQASSYVFLTINPNMFVTSSGDPLQAVYQSGGADLGTLSAVSVEVYQDYLDQIPKGADGREMLPYADLEEAYLLNNTSSGLMIANQDNSFSFTDQRKFLGVTALYDNNGATNFGSDILYWSLNSANLTPIFKRSALRQLNIQRELFKDDLPAGCYYFDFQHRPIDTQAYGNVQLVANPSLVSGSSSVMLLGYEMFGRIGQVARATALPSGA